MSVLPTGTDGKGRFVYDGAVFHAQIKIDCAHCYTPILASDTPTSAKRGPRWAGYRPDVETAFVHDRCADAQDAWAESEKP